MNKIDISIDFNIQLLNTCEEIIKKALQLTVAEPEALSSVEILNLFLRVVIFESGRERASL